VKKRRMTKVSHCSHAVDPVSGWYDAKPIRVKRRMRASSIFCRRFAMVIARAVAI